MLENAAELLGHDEVQQLVDLIAEQSPKLIEQLIPNAITLSGLLKILQSLLREKIPVRDMRTIAECLHDTPTVPPCGLGHDPVVSLDDKVRGVFHTLLSRFPSDDELQVGMGLMKEYGDEGIRDLGWSLMNSPEFLYIQ